MININKAEKFAEFYTAFYNLQIFDVWPEQINLNEFAL